MKKGKSEVWNFCSKLLDGTAACNICGRPLRGAKGGNTSTLWSHLESKHNVRRPGAFGSVPPLYSASTLREMPEGDYVEKEDPFLQEEDIYGDKSARRTCKLENTAKGMNAEGTDSLNINHDYVAASNEIPTHGSEDVNSIEFNNEDSPFVNESTYVRSSADINTPGPSKIRHSRKSQGFLSYLSFLKHKEVRVAKHKKEALSLRERKLQLENEKLQFERAKFELERREREAKLEIERAEHEHRIAMEKKQLEIIELLTRLVNKG